MHLGPSSQVWNSLWLCNSISDCVFSIELLFFPCSLFHLKLPSSGPFFCLLRPENSHPWCLYFSRSNPSENFLGSTFKIYLDFVSLRTCHKHFGLSHHHFYLSYWDSLLRTPLLPPPPLPPICFQHRDQWTFKHMKSAHITLAQNSPTAPISPKSQSSYNCIKAFQDLVSRCISDLLSCPLWYSLHFFYVDFLTIPSIHQACYSLVIAVQCAWNALWNVFNL